MMTFIYFPSSHLHTVGSHDDAMMERRERFSRWRPSNVNYNKFRPSRSMVEFSASWLKLIRQHVRNQVILFQINYFAPFFKHDRPLRVIIEEFNNIPAVTKFEGVRAFLLHADLSDEEVNFVIILVYEFVSFFPDCCGMRTTSGVEKRLHRSRFVILVHLSYGTQQQFFEGIFGEVA